MTSIKIRIKSHNDTRLTGKRVQNTDGRGLVASVSEATSGEQSGQAARVPEDDRVVITKMPRYVEV